MIKRILLSLALLWSGLALADATYISQATIASGGSYTRAAGATVVCVLNQKQSNGTELTYNSVAKSPAYATEDTTTPTQFVDFYVWLAAEGTDSSSTVTVTAGGTLGDITCTSWSGINQTTPVGDTDLASDFSPASLGVTMTTTAGDAVLVGVGNRSPGGVSAWSNGETQIQESATNNGGSGAVAYLAASGSSTAVGATFDADQQNIVLSAIVLQQAVGGGGSETAPLAYQYYQQGK